MNLFHQIPHIFDKLKLISRYIGQTNFAPGDWAGVELDTAQGIFFLILKLYIYKMAGLMVRQWNSYWDGASHIWRRSGGSTLGSLVRS